MQVSVETTGALERRMEVSVPRERIERRGDVLFLVEAGNLDDQLHGQEKYTTAYPTAGFIPSLWITWGIVTPM